MSVLEQSRPAARRLRRRRSSWYWAGQVLSWLLLMVVLAGVLAVIVVPRVAGAQSYTVLTGSMEPGLPPGTLAVVKPVDPKDLAIGDVITYQIKSGEPAVVTHRIVAVTASTDGQLRLITQGDANNAPDAESVRPVQVRGELWYSIPLLGYLNNAITGEWHIWLLWTAVGGLLAYAAFMLVGAYLDKRREVA